MSVARTESGRELQIVEAAEVETLVLAPAVVSLTQPAGLAGTH